MPHRHDFEKCFGYASADLAQVGRCNPHPHLLGEQFDQHHDAALAIGHLVDALDAGESSPQIDQVMATLKPQAAIAPPPSAATLQLAQASTEEIDAELLAIFLEEAREVLATIDDSRRTLEIIGR